MEAGKVMAEAKRRVAKAQKRYDKAAGDQLIAHLAFENAKDALDEATDDLRLIELYGGK